MEYLALLVLGIFFTPIILSIVAITRSSKIRDLEDRIQSLEAALRESGLLKKQLTQENAPRSSIPEAPRESIKHDTSSTAARVSSEPAAIMAESSEEHRKEPSIERKADSRKEPQDLPREPSQFTKVFLFLTSQERLFGFIGVSLALVGVSFLTIYLGTVMSAFLRFILISGAALLIGLLSWRFTKSRTFGQIAKIALSFSAALYLFASFASGGLPTFQWIDNQLLALALLSSGIGLNLLLGSLQRSERFLLFHHFLSILSLYLIPLSDLPMVLSFILTAITILLSIRRSYLWTAVLSQLLHFGLGLTAWYFGDMELPVLLQISQLIIPGLVWYGIMSIRGDLYKSYARENARAAILVSFIAAAWIFSEMLWLSTIFALAYGLLLLGQFLLEQRQVSDDQKKNSRGKLPLFYSEFLILFSALIHLSLENLVILSIILFIVSALYVSLRILYKKTHVFYFWINAIVSLASISFMLGGADFTFSEFLATCFILLGMRFLSFLYIHYLSNPSFSQGAELGSDEQKDQTRDFIQLWNIMLILLSFTLLIRPIWTGLESAIWIAFLSLGFGIFQFLEKEIQRTQLHILWLQILGFGLYFLSQYSIDFQTLFTHPVLPFIALAFLHSFVYWNKKQLNPLATLLYGSGLSTILLFFAALPKSPFLSQWILTASAGLMFLLAKLPRTKLHIERNQEWFFLGWVSVTAALGMHLFIGLQIESLVAGIRLRTIMEMTILALLLWQVTAPITPKLRPWPVTRIFQGALPHMFSLFALLLVLNYSNRSLLSLGLIAAGAFFCILSFLSSLRKTPLLFYSYLSFLLSAFSLSIQSDTAFSSSSAFLSHPSIFGTVHFLAFAGYIALFYLRRRIMAQHSMKNIIQRSSLFVFIPFFLSLGLFLLRTIPEEYLTITIFAYLLVLYSTALLLRERHFRYAANFGLILAAGRLVFFDLAQVSLLFKATAFIGSGLMFFLLNILYTKFKERLDEDS
jgi:hypothetical protein